MIASRCPSVIPLIRKAYTWYELSFMPDVAGGVIAQSELAKALA